jgi:ribose-phosphate pyrophosphokinase
MFGELKVFTGNSNRPLADKLCAYLGIKTGIAEVRTFSDGEIFVEIGENVRGCDVFVLQSTCAPANNNLMELLIMMDAAKRASAASITALLPYFGYARQDRKVAPRTPISAKLVADLITNSGANRIVTMDLHAGQIQGFFNIPVDNLFATPVLMNYLKDRLQGELVMVSPDAGGVERARAFAKRLDASLAIIDKRREKPNVAEIMNIVGDVKDKTAVLLDDMVDTAGTITQAANALRDNGASQVFAACTHPVLSGKAVDKIETSALREMVVTDTIPLSDIAKSSGKIKALSVSELLGEAVKRIHSASSVSSLFV